MTRGLSRKELDPAWSDFYLVPWPPSLTALALNHFFDPLFDGLFEQTYEVLISYRSLGTRKIELVTIALSNSRLRFTGTAMACSCGGPW